jgi:hypothetical protein
MFLNQTLTRSVLTCCSEAWTVCKGDESRIATAEMQLRRTTEYSYLICRSNLCIVKELNTQPGIEYYSGN